MARVVKVGLLGAGWSANTMATTIAGMDDVQVKAVWNHDIARAKALAEKHGIPCFTDDPCDIFRDDDIELVIISLPHHRHEDACISALDAGKHVLVEKPIATTVQAAINMIAKANASGLHLGVHLQQRFSDATMQAKEIIDAGLLGRILQVHVLVLLKRDGDYFTGSSWRGTWEREGGSALINQSIHDIDRVIHLLGDVDQRHGFFDHLTHPIETEDNAVVAFRFKNGAFATIQASISIKYPVRMETTIFGTEGALKVTPTSISMYPRDGRIIGTNHVDFSVDSVTGKANSRYKLVAHERCIHAFAHAIRTGEPFPVPGSEALRSLALVEAIYKSSKM